jgi:activating signal cointegrator complex subunit 3
VYVAPMKALASEVTDKFSKRLGRLGLVVKELTGDMQLSRREITDTHMLVVTPEKWDVMTRKSSDAALTSLVKLLIIDEIHLLNEDRGAVLEAIVARTLRQVERSQSMIRIGERLPVMSVVGAGVVVVVVFAAPCSHTPWSGAGCRLLWLLAACC